ncbi:hypothetical protein Sros01_79480 [Streptomyces roseochromogenus]|nr:hypothetical protein Sros01_79480 [Streptomyces roseochromogenus]
MFISLAKQEKAEIGRRWRCPRGASGIGQGRPDDVPPPTGKEPRKPDTPPAAGSPPGRTVCARQPAPPKVRSGPLTRLLEAGNAALGAGPHPGPARPEFRRSRRYRGRGGHAPRAPRPCGRRRPRCPGPGRCTATAPSGRQQSHRDRDRDKAAAGTALYLHPGPGLPLLALGAFAPAATVAVWLSARQR